MPISVGDHEALAVGGESASIPSPTDDRVWDFVFVTQRTENGLAQPDPEPVVTSPATLLHFADGNYRTGEIRSYDTIGVGVTDAGAGGAGLVVVTEIR